MILPATHADGSLILERYCSTRGADSFSTSSKMHDFVLDVEIQLSTEKEGAEILVDEVVEGVACGIALEMCDSSWL